MKVSDEDKAAVPEEVLRAARNMGQKAYKERLQKIKMDPVDAELYEQFSASVQKQVLYFKIEKPKYYFLMTVAVISN